MSAPEDEAMMDRALGLARKGWGATHPNPMVGCVVAAGGRVLSEGYHAADGGAHAERVALEALGGRAPEGATLYVTLEPCSTHGRTGACTDLILASGIRRVVAGAADPNRAHAGRGFDLLRAGGVEVVSGVLQGDCEDLNLIFNHWITRGSPLLAGKLAMTLDGRAATRTGQSHWITGEPARQDAHRWRKLFPAIAVGAGTLRADNPRLTTRLAGAPEECPVRFVFDGLLGSAASEPLPGLFTDAWRGRTIALTTRAAGDGRVGRLRDLGVGVWSFASRDSHVPLDQFRARCAAEGIAAVLMDGGPRLVSGALAARQLDYLFLYHAPVLLADDAARAGFGGMRTDAFAGAPRLSGVRRAVLADDSLTRGFVAYP
jgi:diaminohydroxyphosphoribosylaminopyrimidine deaminase/5-amino-6-(5-phosphoribosylamino)uracil reductase